MICKRCQGNVSFQRLQAELSLSRWVRTGGCAWLWTRAAVAMSGLAAVSMVSTQTFRCDALMTPAWSPWNPPASRRQKSGDTLGAAVCVPKIGDKHNSKGKEFKVIPYSEWKSQMNVYLLFHMVSLVAHFLTRLVTLDQSSYWVRPEGVDRTDIPSRESRRTWGSDQPWRALTCWLAFHLQKTWLRLFSLSLWACILFIPLLSS